MASTVIEKGAPGVGHVTEAQPKKGFGRKGKLNFSIDTVLGAIDVRGKHPAAIQQNCFRFG